MRSDTIKAILSRTLPEMGIHADANETLAFTRQLEHVFTKVYEYEYPDGAGRRLVPIDTSVPTGAEAHTYRMTDDIGEADIIDSYADDLPLVEAYGTEHVSKVIGLGDAFFVSVQDLRRAAMMGFNIDQRKAIAARKMVERKLDALLATGNTKVGFTGLANHATPAGDLCTPVNGNWLDAATTAAEIQADIEKLCRKVFVDTKGVHGNPDNGSQLTIAVSTAQYARLASTRLDSFNTLSLLQYLTANLPMVREITSWNRLELADAAGTGPRVVAYHKDPDVISGVVPQEFEIMPMQARNLGYYVPCHMRFGGVVVRFPKALAYMDACGT